MCKRRVDAGALLVLLSALAAPVSGAKLKRVKTDGVFLLFPPVRNFLQPCSRKKRVQNHSIEPMGYNKEGFFSKLYSLWSHWEHFKSGALAIAAR